MNDDAARVYVIDDDPSVRAALADLLESISLDVFVFDSAQAFLDYRRADAPACLVLDIRMPGMSGLEFQRQMAERNLHLPVVFITAHGDVPMSVQAMKAGAVDFLTKPFRDQELIDAINTGIELDRQRREDARQMQGLRRRFASLNHNERQVFEMVVKGKLNKQIAEKLNVSEVTIKARRSQVKKKLGVNSVAEMTRAAEKLCVAPTQDTRRQPEA